MTAAMLLAAGAWWVWPKYCCRADTANVPADTSDTKKIAPDKVEAPKAEELSLDSVRKFIASKPPAADAIKMAQQLTESNKLLDAQFLLLRYAAEQGDASAARKIGRMYDPSTYTKETSPLPGPNPVQAAKWHKVAAESGDVESQYRYGMLLKNGGTDEDGGPEKAVFWLQRAAAAGHDGARKELEQK